MNIVLYGWELPYNDFNTERALASSYELLDKDELNDPEEVREAIIKFATPDDSPLFISEKHQKCFYGLIVACWDNSAEDFTEKTDIEKEKLMLSNLKKKLRSLRGKNPEIIVSCQI